MQTPNSTTHKPSTRKIDEIQEFLDLYYISWFRINQTYNRPVPRHSGQHHVFAG